MSKVLIMLCRGVGQGAATSCEAATPFAVLWRFSAKRWYSWPLERDRRRLHERGWCRRRSS